MHAYLEPSAVDAAVRAGITPADFRERLAHAGYEPATGLHMLHEQGRNVVRGHLPVARAIFQFLDELNPAFHQPASNLLKQERDFIHGVRFIAPGLEGPNLDLARSEVRLMAQGKISRGLRRLIEARDADIAATWSKSTEDYLRQVRELRQRDPKAAPRPKSFDDFLHRMRRSIGPWVQGLDPEPMTRAEAELIVRDLDILVAHRTQLRLWLYMAYICLRDNRVPGRDRLDDFRHVLEASYCYAFVTNDEGQAKAAPRLNPDLRVVRARELL